VKTGGSGGTNLTSLTRVRARVTRDRGYTRGGVIGQGSWAAVRARTREATCVMGVVGVKGVGGGMGEDYVDLVRAAVEEAGEAQAAGEAGE
jgi:hypothetical protein